MTDVTTQVVADSKSRIGVPLGVLVAILFSYLVWIHMEVVEVRGIAERPDAQTQQMFDQIIDRLVRMESLMMERRP